MNAIPLLAKASYCSNCSFLLHVALSDQFFVDNRRGEDLGHCIGAPVVFFLEVIVCDTLFREVHDGRASAACADLCVASRISQVDVHLVATFNRGHG